jgi:uncharacterized membrane protein
MIEQLIASDLSRYFLVIIISALPIAELRGAIPIAINLFHMPWYEGLYLSIIGNMLPVPILLLFLESLAKLVSKVVTGKKLVDWLFSRTRKHTGVIEKYETVGLALFVAIPIPFTGAWTGCLAAFLLGLRFRYAFLSILIGVIIAGFIVLILSLLGWIGAAIAVVGLIILGVLGAWKL